MVKKFLVGKNNAGQKNGSVNEIGVKYSTFFYNFIGNFLEEQLFGENMCVWANLGIFGNLWGIKWVELKVLNPSKFL
jgi:hypothetical protein